MKTAIRFVFFAFLCFSTTAFAQLSSSKWQSNPMNIDGNDSDWETMPRFFNSEASVQYEVRNDTKNLYIILKSSNRSTQMQLLRAGFSVKIKTNSPSFLKSEITFFPSQMNNFPFMGAKNENQNHLIEKSAFDSIKILKDSASLNGFLHTSGIITSQDQEKNNICFAKNRENHEQIVYEIQIPLRELFEDDYSLADITQTALQLQVVINELSKNSMKEMIGRTGKGMHEGMRRGEMGGELGDQMGGRMRGGDMQMGGGMGRTPEMQRNMNNESDFSMSRKNFNIKFTLATKE